MRPIAPILAVSASLLLLAGCTGTQVKEGAGWAAGSLFMVALDVALDGPDRRATERQRWEDNPANRWATCLSPCAIGYDKPTEAELEEKARSKRLKEAAEYEAGINDIILALDEAERQPGDAAIDTTATQRERQYTEQLLRRDEAYENWLEFDEFVRSLEDAEQQPVETPTNGSIKP